MNKKRYSSNFKNKKFIKKENNTKEYISISISRALSKVKIIDSRIYKALSEINYRERKTKLKSEESKKIFLNTNKSLYSKVADLLIYKNMLLQKIAFYNATVMFDKYKTLYQALLEEKILKEHINILQSEINSISTSRVRYISIFSKEDTNKNIISDLEIKVQNLIEEREAILKKINEINKKTYFKIPK